MGADLVSAKTLHQNIEKSIAEQEGRMVELARLRELLAEQKRLLAEQERLVMEQERLVAEGDARIQKLLQQEQKQEHE